MSLLGAGAMVAWHNLKQGSEVEHDDWHSHEHMAERVGIPGFRRGRRYRSLAEAPELFIMYEVDDIGVLKSSAYQDRLNSPTEWTSRVVPNVCDMNRTLCRVIESHGHGVGAFVLSVRLTADPNRRDMLISALGGEIGPDLAAREGLLGAHLLEGDAEASGVKTDEMRMRGGPDQITDLALLVEAYDRSSLQLVAETTLLPAVLEQMGGLAVETSVHQLAHVLSEADLGPS